MTNCQQTKNGIGAMPIISTQNFSHDENISIGEELILLWTMISK